MLGVTTLAHHSGHYKGPPPDDPRRLAEFERGYRDGLYAAPLNNYRSSADYRSGFDAGANERNNRVAYNRTNDWGERQPAAAELLVACANEADRQWNLGRGSTVPGTSRRTGDGMYEVDVAAGWRVGTCTVGSGGDVRGIVNK
jgi:hypothetical protein